MTHFIENDLTFRSSPFDILVRNFFDSEGIFDKPNHRHLKHPVDIIETEDGLTIDIACVGLDKNDVDVTIEDDILKVSYENEAGAAEEDYALHYKGIKKSSFNLGWKIARKFDLAKSTPTMDKGLLSIFIPVAKSAKKKSLTIK